MPRSKSNGRKKAAASSGGFDLNDPNIRLGVTVLTLAVAVAFTSGGGDVKSVASPDTWFSFFEGDGPAVNFPGTSYALGSGLLMFLHVLNVCNKNGAGSWYDALVACTLAAYGSWIVSDILNGNAPSILTKVDELNTLVVCWLLTNVEIPQVGFTVFGKVSELVGSFIGLQTIMDLASLVWSLNFLLDTVSAQNNIYAAVVFGVAVHCAADFFPLSNGITIVIDDAMERAFWVAVFMQTEAFKTLPVVGGPLNQITEPVVNAVGGGNHNFVVAVVVLNELFGKFLPLNPIATVKDTFFSVTGISR